MGFLEFLKGALKVLLGGGLFLIAAFSVPMLFMYGQTELGIIIGVIGGVGGLYAQYHHGQQAKRLR